MAIQSKTVLKTYFQAGDKPTQQQFSHLIDSLAHVSDVNPFQEPVPVHTSVTIADVGKLAMLDYDGQIKVYQESPSFVGTKGKWKLTFNALSLEYTLFKYIDAKNTMNFGAYNWLNGAATTSEEALNFKNFILSSHADKLTATMGATDNEVLLEQVTAFAVDNEPYFDYSSIEVTEIIAPIPNVSQASKRICVGIIKSVNETAHTALFDDILVMQAESAPDIAAILSGLEDAIFTQHLFQLVRLVGVPASGGKLKPINENVINDDPSWIFNNLHNLMYFFIKPHATSGKYYILKRGLG